MVRSAPEQYLWMHRIWKSRPRHERLNKPFPDNLKEKLRALPWMTEDELNTLVQRSDEDRAMLAAKGLTQMP
jgi:KDO2-lipid IV(A) lauroyltransferase